MKKVAITSEPVHELIATRWSGRAFADRQLDERTVVSLFEAARWAPSCFNEQPWRFVTATRANANAHDRLVSCLSESNQRWAKHAPLLILTVAKTTFEKNGRPNRHAFHDVGLAVGQLTLQANALGLTVHQMAGFDLDAAKAHFAVPAGFEPVTVVAVGYPGDPERLNEAQRAKELAPRNRRAIDAVVFHGRFQEP